MPKKKKRKKRGAAKRKCEKQPKVDLARLQGDRWNLPRCFIIHA